MLESPEMVLPYSPAADEPLRELFIVHVGALACEVGPDAMGRTAAFVPVPFGGVMSSDPVDNVVGFLIVSIGLFSLRARGKTH